MSFHCFILNANPLLLSRFRNFLSYFRVTAFTVLLSYCLTYCLTVLLSLLSYSVTVLLTVLLSYWFSV
jgi:hypothetical protein